MKRLLVTGASGFLGWNVVNVARAQGYHVVAQYRTAHPKIKDVACFKADLSNEAQTIGLIETTKPQIIIHCAAASHPNYCQQNREESFKGNVTACKTLSKICGAEGIKLVFTSTDLVFDGTKGNYAEDDDRNPIMLYGEHKAMAEDAIKDNAPESAICRMPLMFGNVGSVGSSFIQGFIQKFSVGEKLGLFFDEFRNTLHAHDAANGLLMSAEHVTGTIHIGGKEKLSRFDFGILMADAFGFDKNLIERISNDDVKMAAPRAKDASMNCSFAFATGFNPRLVKDRLLELV